jgi:4-hydroxy-3-polyprenylbenzoate decarboxylase
VLSNYAPQVIAEELPGGLRLPDGVKTHNVKSMNAPFASGSNPPDAMVVIPCTMGTMGRIAHGYSEDVLLRAADVVLKERKKLILVPRETPLSLVHVKNMELLLLAGRGHSAGEPGFLCRPENDPGSRGHRRRPRAGSSRRAEPARAALERGKGMK